MTRRDIAKLIADSYASGVAMAMKGTLIENDVLNGLIAEAYMEAFENGIVYNQWDTFSNDFYTIKTDAAEYKKYAEDQLVLKTDNHL